MTEDNRKAWEILTEDERLALTLKHGHSKSSWEAGEIAGKAHYKFLEIEARAKHYLKLFSDHFSLYDELIPDYIPMDERVRKYFHETIRRRLTIKEAVSNVNNFDFKNTKVREELIVINLKKLLNSQKAIEQNIALLIFEFDRWNNYRILPRDIQEPSAFKRRNKKADLQNLKNILTMPSFTIEQLVNKYTYKLGDSKVAYMPVVSKFLDSLESIIPVKYEESILDYLSKLGFYVFAKKERANEFYKLITTYDLLDKKKSCRDGQKFWPVFRLLIKSSINYNKIQKRIPSRKFLETALKDGDINFLNPQKNDFYGRRRKPANKK